jgi:multisubunit Na+/H+ antiporter MnhG subunit
VGLVAGCAATMGFLLVQILTYGYGRDQGIYAVVARAVLDGQMPYRDAWDFKPPGVFLVYALARALFGGDQIGIRVLEAIGLAATSLGLVRLADAYWRRPAAGWIGAASFVLIHAQLDFWHTAQPESFGGMLTVFALWLAAQPRGSRTRLAWLGAGALFGAAGLLKPPLAGGGVVLALALAWAERERGVRAAAAPMAIVAAGGALPFVACLAWFWARGALSDLHETLFVFTPHYTALGWEGASLPSMLWRATREWLIRYSMVTLVGMFLVGAFGVEREERRGVALLAGVTGVHLLGVALQGKFFPYHYGATWPVTALLAALGLHKLWERAAAHGAGAALGYAVGLAAVVLSQAATKDVPDDYSDRCADRSAIALRAVTGRLDDADRARLDELASVADVNAAANRAVAEVLRERVPAGRPVLVWGFEPVIYDLADRPSATRYLYNVPQRVAWAAPAMRARLMDDLRARPPAAIVVERRDVFPMVTGNVIDSADTIAEFGELRSLLEDGYEPLARVEDLEIYFERGAAR